MGYSNFQIVLITINFFLLIFNTYSQELKNNSSQNVSLLEECRRTCSDSEPPRHCYYHLTIENFHTMGSPCLPCRQNGTEQLINAPNCQCIEADGMKRTVLSINRIIPGPSIQVCQFDKLTIDVENRAEGIEVSLHWHGLFQKGFQYYDGVPMVTQCPITFGSTFRYEFTVNNAGTFFYHAHVATQKMDGQFGSLIVRQTPTTDPHWSRYDEDVPNHVIIVHDWMHSLSTAIYSKVYVDFNPAPDNVLINGRGTYKDSAGNTTNVTLTTFYVKSGKRYRFRFINSFSLRCSSIFTIEKHNLSIIAQDGEPVYPESVTSLHSSSGERVDFILTANQKPGSYWIQLRGLNDCARGKLQQLAILSYVGASKEPQSLAPTYDKFLPQGRVHNPETGTCETKTSDAICVNQFKAIEDSNLRLTKGEPDQRLILSLELDNFINRPNNPYNTIGSNEKSFYPKLSAIFTAMIDGIIYTPPTNVLITKKPDPKYFCNRKHNTENCPTPCHCLHIVNVKKDSVVEVVLYDKTGFPGILHPFHLHGYTFTVLKIGFGLSRNLTHNDIDGLLTNHKKILNTTGYDHQSPRKDTIIVPASGYVIFRFLADNPGWWFFHCHIDWHQVLGMSMIFQVGEPKDLPPVPPDFPKCGSWVPPM